MCVLSSPGVTAVVVVLRLPESWPTRFCPFSISHPADARVAGAGECPPKTNGLDGYVRTCLVTVCPPPQRIATISARTVFVSCFFCCFSQESMASPQEFTGALKTSLWIIWGKLSVGLVWPQPKSACLPKHQQRQINACFQKSGPISVINTLLLFSTVNEKAIRLRPFQHVAGSSTLLP